MKTLQNNFTTPEQSKQLLELGVPADSADGYYSRDDGYRGGAWVYPKLFESDNPKDKVNFNSCYEGGITMYYPLWSVGRLQEIAKICAKEKEYYYTSVDTVAHQEDFVEWWVKHFTLTDNVLFDFSKLED